MPEGLCLMRTAVETLLTFCPPCPPERKASNSMSSGLMCKSISSNSGKMETVAVEVCTRPFFSVSGMRWTRCTPASYLSEPKTPLPEILIMPSSSTSTLKPLRWAKREYMRRSSSAQSLASSPPAAPLTSRMMLRSSKLSSFFCLEFSRLSWMTFFWVSRSLSSAWTSSDREGSAAIRALVSSIFWSSSWSCTSL